MPDALVPTNDLAKKFVCGIATTGTTTGYPEDACDLITRRIKDCVDAPGLEVRRFGRGALEVYTDANVTDAQQRLIEAVVWGFSLGFKIGTRSLAERSSVGSRQASGTLDP